MTLNYPTLPSRLYAPPPPVLPAPNPRLGRRLLWLVFWLVALAVGVGGTWDGWWHATHVFQGFFSPPHVFIYATCALASAVVLAMTLLPAVRLAFGPGFRVPLFPFPVPGPLVLLGGGLALAGFAGLALDNFWHTAFGLDETGWSFPHAMIGWSLLLTLLGVLSCRLALRYVYPLRWYASLPLGLLAVLCAAVPIVGPIYANRSPATVRAVAAIPALAAQPAFQHATRVTLAGDLARFNPALILLAPLWAGAAFAFARRLDARLWMLAIIVLLSSGGDGRQWALEHSRQFPALAQPANWADLPVALPGLLLVACYWRRVPERWAHAVFGVLFGLLIYGTWDAHTAPSALLLVPLAGAAAVAGAALGRRAFAIVERPAAFATVFPLLGAGVLVPCLTGMIDLYLRLNTP